MAGSEDHFSWIELEPDAWASRRRMPVGAASSVVKRVVGVEVQARLLQMVRRKEEKVFGSRLSWVKLARVPFISIN